MPFALSQEHYDALAAAQKLTGLNRSEVIRQCIRFGLPIVMKKLTREESGVAA